MNVSVKGRTQVLRTLLGAIVFLAVPSLTLAQAVSIASVTGVVADSSGAVVPNVDVRLTGDETGTVLAVKTNEAGLYTMPSVPIGAYTLEVAAPGFKAYKQTGIVLRVNDAARINVALTVGGTAETVEVNASVSMVQTQQNTISQVIGEQQIADLPLNGRDPTQLITLSGAAVDHADGSNISNKSMAGARSIAVAGSAGNTTNYILDGGDNNDSSTNVNMPLPNPDALAQFSVESSALPARNGLHPGGQVNAVTKSGTNTFHGTAFEFLRNGAANAVNYFQQVPDPLKRNQFGGVLGGPVIRGKLFFFGAFQRSVIRAISSPSTAFVPTADALKGDFSKLDGAGCQSSGKARAIMDPVTKAPLPTMQVNPANYDKASLILMQYLPTTTDPCGKVVFYTPMNSTENQYVTRWDWNIRPNHLLYGRYLRDKYILPAVWDPKDILLTTTLSQNDTANTFVIGDTYSLNAKTVNSAHIGFGRKLINRAPAAGGINAATLGVANMYQYQTNIVNISTSSGFSTGGTGQAIFALNSYQWADDVDMSVGKHQVAFGVDVIRNQNNLFSNDVDNGTFSFNGQYSNDPMVDFLYGKLNTFTQDAPLRYALRQTEIGVYGQDTIHLTPKLVANVGLRWEPTMPMHDYFNRGSIFSRDAFNNNVHSQVYPNAPAGVFFYGDPGVQKSFTHDHWLNFSPRLGLVYNPDGEGKSTIRIGGGVLYDTMGSFVTYRVNAANSPFDPLISNSNGPYQFSNPWATVTGGNPFPLPDPSKNVSFTLNTNQEFMPNTTHPPVVYTYNLSVQHQFGRDWIAALSYIGNKTTHLLIPDELNPAVFIPGNSTGVAGSCGPLLVLPKAGTACSSTGNTSDRRVLNMANPAQGKYFGRVAYDNDGINSNYNGVLASLEHRFAHNYTVLTNFTWSKCLGIAPVISINSAVIQQPGNFNGDYGPCTYDVPKLFNLSVVYHSSYRGHGWMSALASDWQIAPIVKYQSGQPVNPSSGTDRSLTSMGNDRPNVVPGTAVHLGGSHTAASYLYLNSAHYVFNPTGTFGNAQHLSLRGPGGTNMDMSLARNFPMPERINLLLRVEAFNVLNHPQFGSPSGNLNGSNFGRITSANDPRILQAVVKVSF